MAANPGPNMYLLYNGSTEITGLSAMMTSSFYTKIESLVEDAGNTNGGTVSVAQSPGGRWYAKVAFADQATKDAFKAWSGANKTSEISAIQSEKEELPGSFAEWEDYLATI
jgi:hypothetical protein